MACDRPMMLPAPTTGRERAARPRVAAARPRVAPRVVRQESSSRATVEIQMTESRKAAKSTLQWEVTARSSSAVSPARVPTTKHSTRFPPPSPKQAAAANDAAARRVAPSRRKCAAAARMADCAATRSQSGRGTPRCGRRLPTGKSSGTNSNSCR
eukprot:scaffold1137_cov280-Prasinococcus_capsulatus_cf.AAC.3